MATVRGVYDLNTRPATVALEALWREAERNERQLKDTGDALDNIVTSKNLTDLQTYKTKFGEFGRYHTQVQGRIRDQSGRTRSAVERDLTAQGVAIQGLESRLDSLDRKRANPSIELEGVGRAIAEVEVLTARLKALGATTASPNVGLPRPSVGGFGGGAGPRGIGMGFGSRFSSPLMLGAGAAALAAAPPLIGGAGALAGSLGQAAFGGGAIGLAGAGVGAVGGGALIAGVASAVPGIKSASDALADYREEVLRSGIDSQASRIQLRAYRTELKQAPEGTRQFLRDRTALSEEWRAAQRPAGANVTAMGSRGIRLGRELTPLIGRSSQQITGAARGSTDDFADFLGNGRSRTFYRQMTREATDALPVMERTTENIVGSFMNVSRAATPFFREAMDFVEGWTQGWQDGTKDIDASRDTMDKWVDELKVWMRLMGASVDLVAELGNAGAQPGGNMVEDLTKQLREWDRWVENNPREVRRFFTDAVDSTEKLAGALSEIVKMLWNIGDALGPVLDQFSGLVSFAGQAGLLSPGGLPLLLAGGAGIRSFGNRGRAGGAGGGGAGFMPGGPAGAAGGGGIGGLAPLLMGGGGQSTYGAARDLGMGRVAALREQVAAAGIGRGVTGAGAAGGALGGSLRGAGGAAFRRLWPLMAVSGGLSALSFDGSLSQRAQAGLSTVSMGAIEMPTSNDEKADILAQSYLDSIKEASRTPMYQTTRNGPGDFTVGRKLNPSANANAQIDYIRKGLVGRAGEEQMIAGGDMATMSPAQQDAVRAAGQAQIQQIKSNVAGSQIADIQGAMGLRTKNGQDPTAAAKQAMDQIVAQAKRMRGETGREFAGMGLDWAKSMARSNPKLKGRFNEMAEDVEKRLRNMGQNVRVIHGRIVDTSTEAWGKVEKQITTRTERARQAGTENLTALQAQALEILRQMGYNPQQINNIKSDIKAGGAREKVAMRDVQQGPTGTGMRPSINDQNFQRGHAHGGRIIGPPGNLRDVVPVGDNTMAAGDELISNRHTERRVNRMLAPYGTTLGNEVNREQRPHYKPTKRENAALGRRMGAFQKNRATGGILRAGRMAERMGLSVGEGPGYGGVPSSGHATNSLHYAGLAYDISGSPELMREYFLKAWASFGPSINELFYDPMGYYYDTGSRVEGAIGGHSDHVHIGFNPSGAAGKIRGVRGAGPGGAMAAGPNPISLKRPKSGLGGIPGAASDRATEIMARGIEKKVNDAIGAGKGGRGGGGAFRGKGMGAFASINHVYDEHNSANGDWGGETLGLNQIAALAEAAGRATGQDIPGMTMAQMTIGESNRRPGATGIDPGGTKGLGLWMITTSFNDDLIAKYGGERQMLNPVKNALAMAEIYKRQGQGAWYGDGSVTDTNAHYHERGGRLGFAGWFGDGMAGHVFNKPTLIGVGERGDEHVQITPMRGRNRSQVSRMGASGGHTFNVRVDMAGAIINNKGDAKSYGDEIGRRTAAKIAKALAESSSVSEKELVG